MTEGHSSFDRKLGNRTWAKSWLPPRWSFLLDDKLVGFSMLASTLGYFANSVERMPEFKSAVADVVSSPELGDELHGVLCKMRDEDHGDPKYAAELSAAVAAGIAILGASKYAKFKDLWSRFGLHDGRFHWATPMFQKYGGEVAEDAVRDDGCVPHNQNRYFLRAQAGSAMVRSMHDFGDSAKAIEEAGKWADLGLQKVTVWKTSVVVVACVGG